jgi:hypothetical protein
VQQQQQQQAQAQQQQQQLGCMQLGQELHRQGMSMRSQDQGIPGSAQSQKLLLRVQIAWARPSSSTQPQGQQQQQQVPWQHCHPFQMPATPWR